MNLFRRIPPTPLEPKDAKRKVVVVGSPWYESRGAYLPVEIPLPYRDFEMVRYSLSEEHPRIPWTGSSGDEKNSSWTIGPFQNYEEAKVAIDALVAAVKQHSTKQSAVMQEMAPLLGEYPID